MVKAFDKICEVQSDKATVEITSRFDGKIVKLHHDIGTVVKVGSALLDIASASTGAVSTGETAKAKTNIPAVAAATEHNTLSHKVLTTPSVRKIAKENNLDLSLVPGTGPKGRILKEDVLRFIKGESKPAVASPPTTSSSPTQVSAVSNSAQQDTVIPIRGVQRLMVKSMTAANAVQHLTLCEEVTFDKLRVLRQQLKPRLDKKGVKLSYMPIIIKATSLALSQFPQLKAMVNSDVTEITHHANHNIGVAMDTPRGLIVPVIKSVQDKSIAQIAAELNVLQEAAGKNAITEAQLSGGTFSLSNIGERFN